MNTIEKIIQTVNSTVAWTDIFYMSFALFAVRGDSSGSQPVLLIPTLEKYFFIKIVINARDSIPHKLDNTKPYLAYESLA